MTMADTAWFFAPRKTRMTYMQVNTRLKSVDATVVEALTKFKADNKNALLTPAIDAAIREPRRSRRTTRGSSMPWWPIPRICWIMTVDTDGPKRLRHRIIAIRNTAAETARDNAGVELELAFEAREAATSAVAAAFTNPQAFYQQLVDRREFTKAAAEAEVIRLAGLTGEDAATDAETTAAATAVTTAQTASGRQRRKRRPPSRTWWLRAARSLIWSMNC